jgi:hypothetical protein
MHENRRSDGHLRRSVTALFVAAAGARGLASEARPSETRVGSLRLDHAVVVVRDLDAAEARFRPAGFRVKPGRLHADNLSNRHVKFRDHTGIELMSLAGPPTDAMARDYAALLATGEQGVYAALWTDDLAPVVAAAKRLGIPTKVTRDAPWEFASFPDVPDASAIFVGAGGTPPSDPESVLAHENGASGLDAAWIDAGPKLEALLRALGGKPCGSTSLPDGRTGIRWPLQSGSLVLVRPERPGGPRLLGVELRRGPAAKPDLLQPIPGFWISMR